MKTAVNETEAPFFCVKEWENPDRDMRPKIRYWVPGAAMKEEDLREEIRRLKERGFGGVEVVALLGTSKEIVRGEDGWGTESWNTFVRIIADETKKLGMSMDLANGPMWPISMPTVTSADDPATLCELTFGVREISNSGVYQGTLPRRRKIREEGTPCIEAVMAYQQRANGLLVQHSYTPLCRDLWGKTIPDSLLEEMKIQVRLPFCEEGCRWLLFAFYRQPSAQKTGEGMFYVVDHLSLAGVKACESYWDDIFQEQNQYPSMESFFCDSLEYAVTMEWTRDFAEEFEKRRGYSVIPYLPFIGESGTYPPNEIPDFESDQENLKKQVNADYCETLTQCYCDYHLTGLERMAQKYGKSIRYQVAYNKPFEIERSALFVTIPENEALGRPAMDSQKLMAAAVHLGRKKRYSFECAAEFGNCYGQNYEDLFWWVKRSLMSGMNAQVLHGASYSGGYEGRYSEDGFLKDTVWPGYEAFKRGVSNNWNRTPSIEDACGCMDTIARMNVLFRKKAKVDLAFYRNSYLNDGAFHEFGLYRDNGKLTNLGYSYESVTTYLLKLPVCKVTNNVLDESGVGYQGLIIPPDLAVSTDFLKTVSRLAADGFPIIWTGEKPTCAEFFSDVNSGKKEAEWKILLDEVWNAKGICHVKSLEEVPSALKTLDILPRVQLDGRRNLTTAVREDEDSHITYVGIYGYHSAVYDPEHPNPEELAVSAIFQKGTVKSTYLRPGESSREEVSLKLRGQGTVYQLNPWDKSSRRLNFKQEKGWMSGKIQMEEDELLLLALVPFDGKSGETKPDVLSECTTLPVRFDKLTLYEFGPETPKEKSFLQSSFSKEKTVEFSFSAKEGKAALKPWMELSSSLETFVGKGIYEGIVFLEKVEKAKRYILHLGEVCDTFCVRVNGRKTTFPDQVLKTVDITELLETGENRIEVQVTSNLFNRLMKDYQIPMLHFSLPYTAKKYGMYETAGKRIFLEVWG